MIERLRKTLQDASDVVGNLGANAKEKGYELIEEWLKSIPTLCESGLEVTSFALGVALSPSLELELCGKHEDFPIERIQELLNQNKSNPVITSVFTTVRSTYKLHARIEAPLRDPLIIKIKVKFPPEINVFLGEPIIY